MNTDNESDIEDSYININELNEVLNENYYDYELMYSKIESDDENDYFFNIEDFYIGKTLFFKNIDFNYRTLVIPNFITKLVLYNCDFSYVEFSKGTKIEHITVIGCFNVFFNTDNLKKLKRLEVKHYDRDDFDYENTFNDLIKKLHRFGKIKKLYMSQYIEDNEDDNDAEIQEYIEEVEDMLNLLNDNMETKKKKADTLNSTYKVVDKLMLVNKEHKNIFTDMIMTYL